MSRPINNDSLEKQLPAEDGGELKNESKAKRWDRKTLIIMTVGVVVTAAVVGGIAFTLITVPRPVPTINFPVSDSRLGIYKYFAVAADAGKCSEAGTRILAAGGSAVDGTIAATICTGVFNMHNSGIGGGFFMTIWDEETQSSYVVDARETAPLAASQDMFEGNVSSVLGPFAIAVPGEIAGYWAAWQRFGRVPWRMLFEPTIEMCRNGFEVSGVLADAMSQTISDIQAAGNQSYFQPLLNYFVNPATGKTYVNGDTIYCKVLATTMERLANANGSDFYTGEIVKDILADLAEAGSPINASDFAEYQAKWRTPVVTELQNGMKVVSTPPPGSGAILGYILNVLSFYNFSTSASQDTLTYHRFVESLKFAYAKRTYLGDESFVPGMEPFVAKLTSAQFANYTRRMINDSFTQKTDYYDPNVTEPARTAGTSHISVIDARGQAVAITSTINTYFGSGIMGRRTGIVFNNEMDDFSSPNKTNYFNLPPSPNNFIVPQKRPQSSTCPAVILDHDPKTNETRWIARLIVGAAGGSKITSGVAYISMRVLWFGETVKQAIDALRLHHQLLPEQLYYEAGMPVNLLDDMRARGHANLTRSKSLSIAQAIQRWSDGSIYANSDFRKVIAYPDGF